MAQQSGIPSPILNDENIAEQRYTKKFLYGLSDFAFEWDEEEISEFASFYFENPGVGYAFHMLKRIFEKIDLFLGIKSPMGTASPWEYFSNVESLAAFSTKITELTETFRGTSEPPVIEKIRIVDRSRVRKKMLKRIANLDPSRRTFESEVLEHLQDRNRILDAFLKDVYMERLKKKPSTKTINGNNGRTSGWLNTNCS